MDPGCLKGVLIFLSCGLVCVLYFIPSDGALDQLHSKFIASWQDIYEDNTSEANIDTLMNELRNTSAQRPVQLIGFLPPVEGDPPKEGVKYLIYRCDTGRLRSCGGWGDRMKGIMTGFIIASLTGRVFKVEIPMVACDLHDFLLPNLYNWRLPRPFHKSVPSNDKDVKYVEVMDKFYQNVPTTNFNKSLGDKKYVYFKTNLDYIDGFKQSKLYRRQLSWMHNLTKDVVYRKIYHTLFKPSRVLQKQLDLLLSKLTIDSDKLICAHVRLGRNPSMPSDAPRHSTKNLPAVWNFVNNHTGTGRAKVFVMSDSQDVITMAGQQAFGDKLVTAPGPLVHIDRVGSKQNVCSGFMKVILEQQVLLHCDVLMVSKSGLSRIGAYVRGTDKGLYCLLGGEVVKCPVTQLNELHKTVG